MSDALNVPLTVDVEAIRKEFPILNEMPYGKQLAYLDNGATAQKPQCVIDAIDKYYKEQNSNIHRGVHFLSEKATNAYEAARTTIKNFINARSEKEVVFVRGTTEAINLIAYTFGRANIGEGDEILVSEMEHHSNIVPWQFLCKERGCTLKVVPISDSGEISIEDVRNMINERTKLVSMVYVSNSLGTVNPIKQVIEIAHSAGVPVLVDGAQSTPHMKVDVQELGCDFFTISGHKLFGPTGIGVLYGREEILEAMPPFHGGGDMIRSVSFSGTEFNGLPFKFEAGTPNIAGSIGLAEAMKFVDRIGYDAIQAQEQDLLHYATDAIQQVPGLRIIGTAANKASVISFVMDGIHPHDIGSFVDRQGVAIRVGHHCTQPVMERFGIPATSRASFTVYNTREEADRLVEALHMVREMFG